MTTETKVKADYCTIFFDDRDPLCRGWAYNVIIDGEHTSGPLDASDDASLDELIQALRAELPRIEIPDKRSWECASDGGFEARS